MPRLRRGRVGCSCRRASSTSSISRLDKRRGAVAGANGERSGSVLDRARCDPPGGWGDTGGGSGSSRSSMCGFFLCFTSQSRCRCSSLVGACFLLRRSCRCCRTSISRRLLLLLPLPWSCPSSTPTTRHHATVSSQCRIYSSTSTTRGRGRCSSRARSLLSRYPASSGKAARAGFRHGHPLRRGWSHLLECRRRRPRRRRSTPTATVPATATNMVQQRWATITTNVRKVIVRISCKCHPCPPSERVTGLLVLFRY